MVNGKVQKNYVLRAPARTTNGPPIPQGTRRGGLKEAYSLEVRRIAVQAIHDPQARNSETIIAARANRQFPSKRTVRRYVQNINERGFLDAFKRSGNKRATVLRRLDLVLLAIYNKKFPVATAAENIAFLWNAFGRHQNPPIVYNESEICKAEQRIGLSRKKVSTTAFQAFSPQNLLRRRQFWTANYPVGIANIPRSEMIDLDEARIILKTANRRFAKVLVGHRARDAGHYKGDGRLVLAAVSGADDNLRWFQCYDRGGTRNLS